MEEKEASAGRSVSSDDLIRSTGPAKGNILLLFVFASGVFSLRELKCWNAERICEILVIFLYSEREDYSNNHD